MSFHGQQSSSNLLQRSLKVWSFWQVLADYFADCGKVTSVRIARGGVGSVKAWLEFESADCCLAAKEHDGSVRT